MQSSFTIRVYKEGDDKPANDLFNLVFNQKRPIEIWNWKFRDNPAFSEKMIILAEKNCKIMGIYPSVTSRFKFGNQIIIAIQIVDNCVHPSSRGGARIQIAMKRKIVERSKTLGVVFGFGFPNDIAYKIGKRLLRYEDLCSLPILFKRLNFRLAFRRSAQAR